MPYIRCQQKDCLKFARSSDTMFCIAHGGGYRCQAVGCLKASACHGVGLAQSFCIKHGGGYRCDYQGPGEEPCIRSAIGKTRLCKRHGGGKRCKHDHCKNPARSGSLYCRRHGMICNVDDCIRPVHHDYGVMCYTHGKSFTLDLNLPFK